MPTMKKLLAALLAFAMVLSLAACGKNKDENQESPTEEHTGEYVYAAQYSSLRENGPGSLFPRLFTDAGFYASSSEKVGVNKPEGAVQEYEGQFDVYEDRYYFVGFDGRVTRLDKYVPLPARENTEGYKEFDSSSSSYGLQENGDGKLLTLACVYTNYYTGPEGVEKYSDEYYKYYENYRTYYIRLMDTDGSEISCTEITAVDENTYLNSPVLDSEGNLVVNYSVRSAMNANGWMMDEEEGIMAIKPDGSLAYKVEPDGYVTELVKLRDGRIGYTTWGKLTVIDPLTGKLTDTYEIPQEAYNLIPGGGEYDFCYTGGINFYGYDLEAGEETKILDWISCDVNNDQLNGTWIRPDGTVIGVMNDYHDDRTVTSELVTLALVPYESVAQKTHLTMAVQYLEYDTRAAVIDFNRRSDRVHIDIVDYSEYNTPEDYSAGLTKLTTEVLAGHMPDILSLEELPYVQLAAKGLLEDLYPYLDADKELSRDIFFDNILKALEVNGGLYQVSSGFTIVSAMGASSVVGDKPGWTYEELYAALEKMPEGCEIFGKGMTKEEVLQMCLYMSMDSFIDWGTGTCSFDSDDFIRMLEFCDRFALEFDYSNYDSAVDSDRARITAGQQLLMTTGVDFDEIKYSDFYFGGETNTTYIGFPTTDGSSGSALMFQAGMAMSSQCADKEAAWEFMRTFLTEAYQSKGYYMPTNRVEFDRQLEKEATPEYETDGEGNYLLDENGERIEKSRGGMASSDGFSMSFYALSQEQVRKIREVVETTDKIVQFDIGVYEKIIEEARPYFNGQKTAQEVARLIQSKINLYVNERL